MRFVRRQGEDFESASQVEKYRAAAVKLRRRDPEAYAQAFALATGTDAEAAAERDPDAYVAFVLRAQAETKHEDRHTARHDKATSASGEFDYWPQIDLYAITRSVDVFLADIQKKTGVAQLHYPDFAVRRLVAARVIEAAASIDSDLVHDGEALLAANDVDEQEFLYKENARLDEELERYIARQHLTWLVDAVMSVLTAE